MWSGRERNGTGRERETVWYFVPDGDFPAVPPVSAPAPSTFPTIRRLVPVPTVSPPTLCAQFLPSIIGAVFFGRYFHSIYHQFSRFSIVGPLLFSSVLHSDIVRGKSCNTPAPLPPLGVRHALAPAFLRSFRLILLTRQMTTAPMCWLSPFP